MNLLEVEGLVARRGGRIAEPISFSVEERGALAVLGVNGAGKSTLLRLLAGAQPADGRVRLAGTDIGDWGLGRRVQAGVVLVPEGHHVFTSLTIEENVRLGAFHRGRDELPAILEDVYGVFPVLGERRGSPAGQLSGGQQQMLALGRALAGRPRVLLLDEPSLGLAAGVIGEVYRRLEQLRTEGLTVVLVEQQVRRALRFAEDAFVLHQGRVVLQGTSAELLDNDQLVNLYRGGSVPERG